MRRLAIDPPREMEKPPYVWKGLGSLFMAAFFLFLNEAMIKHEGGFMMKGVYMAAIFSAGAVGFLVAAPFARPRPVLTAEERAAARRAAENADLTTRQFTVALVLLPFGLAYCAAFSEGYAQLRFGHSLVPKWTGKPGFTSRSMYE